MVLCVLSALLAPSVLCAVPTASSPAEHQCCQHMRAEDCAKTNMSGCCPTLVPSVLLGLPELTKKFSVSPISDLAPLSVWDSRVAAVVLAAIELRQELKSPPLTLTKAIEVLRV